MNQRAAWIGGLIAGTLPPLLVGFLASAVANRYWFAVWGLFTASLCATFLRWGFAGGWNGWFIAGRSVLVLALSTTLLGRLVASNQETLELGLRAAVPAIAEAASRPENVYKATIVLGVIGTLCVLIGRGAQNRLRMPPPGALRR